MIGYAVVAGVCFAWACVATSIAVARDQQAKLYASALVGAKAENEALRDREMATTLSEYHHARGVVAHAHPEAPYSMEYSSDPFGLVIEALPVSTE